MRSWYALSAGVTAPAIGPWPSQRRRLTASAKKRSRSNVATSATDMGHLVIPMSAPPRRSIVRNNSYRQHISNVWQERGGELVRGSLAQTALLANHYQPPRAERPFSTASCRPERPRGGARHRAAKLREPTARERPPTVRRAPAAANAPSGKRAHQSTITPRVGRTAMGSHPGWSLHSSCSRSAAHNSSAANLSATGSSRKLLGSTVATCLLHWSSQCRPRSLGECQSVGIRCFAVVSRDDDRDRP